MSEKITFQELIDSIADETDNSKKFTHDFLKDFVDVIHEGLENDGKVNIAGLGKFGLRKVDEREGYNPQTGESMTIPPHNKVVFKPYKDLRELVNAPYAHMEPQIIEEEASDEEKEQASAEQDFIPTAPPTDVKDKKKADEATDQKDKDEKTSTKQTGRKTSEKFSLDEETGKEDTYSDDDDIVEFSGEQRTTDENEDNIESITGESDSENTKKESEKKPVSGTGEIDYESPAADSTSSPEPLESRTTFQRNTSKRRQGTNFPLIIAAAVIILLLAVGAGIFLMELQPGDDITSNQQPESAIIDQQQDESEGVQAAQDEQETEDEQQQSEVAGQQAQSQEDNARDVEVEQGQTLWGMASNQYNNPQLWPWIYDANKASIDNPDLIIAGQTLSVPLPSGNQNALTASDSVEVARGYVETYKWYKNEGMEDAKLYLWVATNYSEDILEKMEVEIDEADLAFANRPQLN